MNARPFPAGPNPGVGKGKVPAIVCDKIPYYTASTRLLGIPFNKLKRMSLQLVIAAGLFSLGGVVLGTNGKNIFCFTLGHTIKK
jgi:hypothetical protein